MVAVRQQQPWQRLRCRGHTRQACYLSNNGSSSSQGCSRYSSAAAWISGGQYQGFDLYNLLPLLTEARTYIDAATADARSAAIQEREVAEAAEAAVRQLAAEFCSTRTHRGTLHGKAGAYTQVAMNGLMGGSRVSGLGGQRWDFKLSVSALHLCVH